MVKLIAKTPCADLLPQSIGVNTLTEHSYAQITSIAPYQGQSTATSTALKSATGLTFPKPNRSSKSASARILWSGHGTALLCGPTAPDLPNAATTDQSDGWAIVRLTGPQITDILARLVPIDLRTPTFNPNHTARTLLGHMHVHITRIDAQTIEIMAFRSMAQTLIHDITLAMRTTAARS